MTQVIECQQLNVRFRTDSGEVTAVSDLDFSVNAGECLGVVGESGSGKSQTFLAMFGLLAPNGAATGSIRYRGTELLNAPRSTLDGLRGNRLAMIFQDALSGLTPTMQVGEIVRVEWSKNENGQPIPKPVPGTEQTLPAQLVLLAMGFVVPEPTIARELGIVLDARTNFRAELGRYATSVPGVFAAGDCRRGQSLVVWAINEGRGAARECARYLMGKTELP